MSGPDPVVRCPICRGEGLLSGAKQPRVCWRCQGHAVVVADWAKIPLPARPKADELEPHELAPWSPHYAPRSS